MNINRSNSKVMTRPCIYFQIREAEFACECGRLIVVDGDSDRCQCGRIFKIEIVDEWYDQNDCLQTEYRITIDEKPFCKECAL